MQFRLQYLKIDQNYAPSVLFESQFSFADVDQAIDGSHDRPLPGEAVGWRLLDLDGAEVASWINPGAAVRTRKPLFRH